MSMTRAEAIERLEKLIALYEMASTENKMIDYSGIIDTLKFSLTALRFPTREMVERMRGEWIEDEFAISHCSLCGYEQEEPELITPFCPLCGAPMTDKAMQMVMERLEELKNES